MIDGFDFDELKDLEKEVLRLVKKYPKIAKKFIAKEGLSFRRLAVKKARKTVKKRTGNYIKGFRRGKAFQFKDNAGVGARVYNSMPHAHLIELGHRIVDKNGREHGFKKGYFIVEQTSKEYNDTFIKNADKFIEMVLKEGGF